MKALKILVCLVAVAFVFAAYSTPAQANLTTGSWIMDQSNTYADGVNYGTVVITADDATGEVLFEVDAEDVYYKLDNFPLNLNRNRSLQFLKRYSLLLLSLICKSIRNKRFLKNQNYHCILQNLQLLLLSLICSLM